MVAEKPAPKKTMAPKQITMRDLVSKHKSPAAKAIYDRALKHAYEDQQKLLKEAAKLK